MIIYNVTINIDNAVHDEWMDWMREVHMPDMMKTGLFTKSQMCKLLDEVHNDGTTYAVQYFCNSMSELEEYQRLHAFDLQNEIAKRFKDKFVVFRTVLEILEQDDQ